MCGCVGPNVYGGGGGGGITNSAPANTIPVSDGIDLVSSGGGLLWDGANKRLSLPLSELAGIAVGELGAFDVTDGVGIAIGVNEAQGNQPVYLARGTGGTGEPQLVFRRSNGTVGSPTNLSASQGAGSFIINGYDAGNPAVIASFNFEVDSIYSGSGAYPGVIAARVGNGLGATTERLRIDSAGNFTVTADPTAGIIALNAKNLATTLPTANPGAGMLWSNLGIVQVGT